MTSAPAEYPDSVEFDNGPDGGSRKWRRDWASAVMRDDRLGAATWVTALVLAERAWSQRRTFHASRRSLAAITGRSERVEREHLDALALTGWVVDTGEKKNRATVWRLVWPEDYREHRGQRSGRTIRPIRPECDPVVSAGSSARYVSEHSRKSPGRQNLMGGSSARFPRYLSAQGHPEGPVTHDDEETGLSGPVLPDDSEAVQLTWDNEDGALRDAPTPDDEVCPVAEDEPGWELYDDCICGRGTPHAKWFNRQMVADGRRG